MIDRNLQGQRQQIQISLIKVELENQCLHFKHLELQIVEKSIQLSFSPPF